MAGVALEEARERLERFLESKRVTSLHLGHHRIATVREVQSRTLTEYLAHALLDSREHELTARPSNWRRANITVVWSVNLKKLKPTTTQPKSWPWRPANANHLSPIKKRSIWRFTPNGKTMNQKDNDIGSRARPEPKSGRERLSSSGPLMPSS